MSSLNGKTSKLRLHLEIKSSSLFKRTREVENLFFIERSAQNLESDWQALWSFTTRK
jgi:hypothetical protein